MAVPRYPTITPTITPATRRPSGPNLASSPSSSLQIEPWSSHIMRSRADEQAPSAPEVALERSTQPTGYRIISLLLRVTLAWILGIGGVLLEVGWVAPTCRPRWRRDRRRFCSPRRSHGPGHGWCSVAHPDILF